MFGKLLMAVFMTIELSYILVRMIFPQACLYAALKIKDATVRGARIWAERQAELSSLRVTAGERRPLIIVGGSEMVKKPVEDDKNETG
jgi:hypothetical protein